MEMVVLFVKMLYNATSLSLKVDLSMYNDGMWMEPLTVAVMTMSGRTFHPLFLIFCNRGVYLSNFCWIFSSKN